MPVCGTDVVASQFVNLWKDEMEKTGMFGHKTTRVTQWKQSIHREIISRSHKHDKFAWFHQKPNQSKNKTWQPELLSWQMICLVNYQYFPWFARWILFTFHVSAHKQTHSMTRSIGTIRDQNTSTVLSLIGFTISVASLTESCRGAWQLQARAHEINL